MEWAGVKELERDELPELNVADAMAGEGAEASELVVKEDVEDEDDRVDRDESGGHGPELSAMPGGAGAGIG